MRSDLAHRQADTLQNELALFFFQHRIYFYRPLY